MTGSAIISPCGQYRYALVRGCAPYLVFVMLNPSTADATLDDPTIRRCVSFAAAAGYTGIIVLNLYAYRATKPSDLWRAADPVGPVNDAHLEIMAWGDDVVCAWGANAKLDRVAHVTALLRSAGARLLCLGTTKDGSPRHPLYVAGAQPLVAYSP